jgi:hypothetical protein
LMVPPPAVVAVAVLLLKVIVLPLTVRVSPLEKEGLSADNEVVAKIAALGLPIMTALPVVLLAAVLESNVPLVIAPVVPVSAVPVTEELPYGAGGVPRTVGFWLKSPVFKPPAAVIVPEAAVVLAVVAGVVGRLAAY